MTAALTNATREMCAICFVEYGKNEINDVDKTIQLVCEHIFHTACAAKNAISQEDEEKYITCYYCKQINVPQAKESDVLASKNIYLSKLKEVEEEYDHDTDVTELVPYFSSIYDQLHGLYQEASELSESYESDHSLKYANYIIEDKELSDEDKLIALKMLSAIFIGDLTLRNVEQEAKRWLGKDLPDKIKQKGVLVEYPRVPNEYESFQARISANQLEKHIEAVKQDYQREVNQEILRPYREQAERVCAAVDRALPFLKKGALISAATLVIGKFVMEARK